MTTKPVLFTRLASGTALAVLVGSGPAMASHRAGSDGVAVESAAHAGHTLYVSRHGNDSWSGTKTRPLRTIQAAVGRSAPGGTVLVRPGHYHESVTIAGKDGLTVRATKRGAVWLDGTSAVGHWQKQGSAWVRNNWHHEFDASPTFTWGKPANPKPGWGFINPAHPMAAHPDQVFVNGHPQRQVGNVSDVRKGRFYVDYGSHRLYLGTNPAGRAVRASTLEKALTIRSANLHISGINVRGYAPSLPDMGAVTVGAPHVTVSHATFRNNSTTGVFVRSTNDHLSHLVVRHNGLMGFMGTYADGLRVSDVTSVGNNAERFNMSPASGGAKIGRTTGIMIRNSRFVRNHSSGLWFDESSYKIHVINSRILHNAGHGLILEISGAAIVAGNVIADSGQYGIKINDTNRVQLWNNTIVGGVNPVNIGQDMRDQNPSGSYHDPSLPLPWIVRDISVHNNIIARANPASACMLCVQEHTHRFSADQLRITANGNVYERRQASPRTAVMWARGSQAAALFATVPAFKKATGQETSHLWLTKHRAVDAAYHVLPRVVRAASRVAVPLPLRIARLTGHRTAVRWLGAWH
jgi:hypothetical protein